MRSLTCLLLICLQVFAVYGGGRYGHSDLQKRCNRMLHSRLSKEALYRIDGLIARFGRQAYHALMFGYREIAPRISSMSPAQVETFLCNKMKKAVSNPPSLSYVRKPRRYDECTKIQGEEAQIFSATEQRLAQTAAAGHKVLIGLYYHRKAFRWLGHQPMSYRNWARGEPSDRYRYTDFCVQMDTNGQWMYGSCRLGNILCEKRPIVCGPPASTTARTPTKNQPTPPPPRQARPDTEGPKSGGHMPTTVKPGLPQSGDPAGLKDTASDTTTLEFSMNVDYKLVQTNLRDFSQSFFKAIRKVINPKLITIKKMRSGSTVVTFTLTAPKESLSAMIKELRKAYEKGDFTMTFMNRKIGPTPGFKSKSLNDDDDEPHRDGFPYVYRILIYIFIIVGILIGFTLIVIMVKSLQKRRLRTKPGEEESPPIFWVNGIPTSDLHLEPPPEKDAPPAYSEACQEKA